MFSRPNLVDTLRGDWAGFDKDIAGSRDLAPLAMAPYRR
jgi:hypothetical protein